MAERLHTAGRIRDVTNIRDFIELPGEEVEDSAEDLTVLGQKSPARSLFTPKLT